MFKKLLEDEKGQSSVEAAFALPMFTIAAFMLIQFGWMVYAASSLSYACTHAQYIIAEVDAPAGADMNVLVRDKLIEASPLLASGELKVSNAKVEVLPSTIETRLLPDEDFFEYAIATKNEYTARVAVSADVEYQPIIIFGVTSPVKYSRHIESSKITTETFELA